MSISGSTASIHSENSIKEEDGDSQVKIRDKKKSKDGKKLKNLLKRAEVI